MEDGARERRDATRHVSNLLATLVLGHVRRHGGDEARTATLAALGGRPSLAEIEDRSGRISAADFRRILSAAADALGGLEGLRAFGRPGTIAHAERTETADAMRALGSPAIVLRHLTSEASIFHDLVDIRVDELGPCEWHVELRVLPGDEPSPELCAFLTAAVELIPAAFDAPVEPAVEETCQCRGDRSCSFTLRWASDAASPREARFEARIRDLERRHRAFRDTVADVVLAEDVDIAMSHVVAAAATELDNPAVVLALNPVPGVDRRVFASGLDGARAGALAEQLLDPTWRPDRYVITVPVASRQRRYGRLAALVDDRIAIEERDVLAGYAQLAATALDSVTALEAARREATRAHALLELAATLAESSSVAEMGAYLTGAVPDVVGGDRAIFSVENAATNTYDVVAVHGFPSWFIGHSGTIGANSESLLRDVAHFTPGTASSDMESLFNSLGSQAAVVIPVLVEGERQGWLYVDVVDEPERLAPSPELNARLTGLAAQAATALRNTQLLEHIRHQAFHDALTGLPNRTLILDRAEHLLARARRDNTPVGALFIDLDGFKQINDTLGHAAGDQFLRSVAERLSRTIRESDTLARLGGDEFVVLVEGGTENGAEVLASRLLDVLAEPFDLGPGAPVLVTASIGVATGPRATAAELLRDADIALYRAKGRGKNRYVVFSAEAEVAVRERLQLETELCRAVEDQEFFLLYEPVLDDTTDAPQGVHAVLQWRHPERGVMPAGAFLEALDATGLIVPVGRWALLEACRQLAAWDPLWRITGQLPYVAVDLAARHLFQDDVVEDVETALTFSNLRPEQLVLTIGPASIIDDLDGAASRVRRLAGLGVRVTLDPFLARALEVEVTGDAPERIEGDTEPMTPDALVALLADRAVTASRR